MFIPPVQLPDQTVPVTQFDTSLRSPTAMSFADYLSMHNASHHRSEVFGASQAFRTAGDSRPYGTGVHGDIGRSYSINGADQNTAAGRAESSADWDHGNTKHELAGGQTQESFRSPGSARQQVRDTSSSERATEAGGSTDQAKGNEKQAEDASKTSDGVIATEASQDLQTAIQAKAGKLDEHAPSAEAGEPEARSVKVAGKLKFGKGAESAGELNDVKATKTDAGFLEGAKVITKESLDRDAQASHARADRDSIDDPERRMGDAVRLKQNDDEVKAQSKNQSAGKASDVQTKGASENPGLSAESDTQAGGSNGAGVAQPMAKGANEKTSDSVQVRSASGDSAQSGLAASDAGASETSSQVRRRNRNSGDGTDFVDGKDIKVRVLDKRSGKQLKKTLADAEKTGKTDRPDAKDVRVGRQRTDADQIKPAASSEISSDANQRKGEAGGDGPVREISLDLANAAQNSTEATSQPASRGEAHTTALNNLNRRFQQDLPNDIVRQAKFILKDGDRGEIRLVIRPPELGRMRIQLELDGGRIAGRILVDNGSVRQVVEQNLAQLQRAFAEHGLELGDLDVQSGDHSDQKEPDDKSENGVGGHRSGIVGEEFDAHVERISIYETGTQRINLVA